MRTTHPVLEVRGLRTTVHTPRGPLRVLDGVDLELAEGEVLGLVGESGSGKSVTLRSILGLVHGRVEGEALWRGENLLAMPERRLRQVRGGEIAMIFQEPMTALNPVLTVGQQIRESLAEHAGLRGAAGRARAVELLDQVGIPAAGTRLDEYPHQFSGGMRQRAMIAIALAGKPKLLLADEPTTALDVTIQDQILKLLLRLKEELGMGVVLVTHDLGVIAETSDRVAVMYAGRVVEMAPVRDLFREPRHAYTRGLLASVPSGNERRPLEPIPGSPPNLAALPDGCPFWPRCSLADEACRGERPPLLEIVRGRLSACVHHDRLAQPLAGVSP